MSELMFDVVIQTDTTGSMYACLSEVRRQVEKMVRRLKLVLPNAKFSIGVHGDYCDLHTSYVTKWLDFTAEVDEVCNFIRTVAPTAGGDLPECYELMLHEARALKWREGSKKIYIVIGDDVPHEVGYEYWENGYKRHYVDKKKKVDLDWLNELKLLVEFGIKIFGIHCLPDMRQHSKKFYQTIATASNGVYITLSQLSTVVDAILAIAYLESQGFNGVNEYRAEVTKRERDRGSSIRTDQTNVFDNLIGTKRVTRTGEKNKDGLVPVTNGTFQMLYVHDRIPMKEFIKENGLVFKKGRSFYQFVDREIIQPYKKIVLMDDVGNMFTGEGARKITGIPYGVKKRMTPKDVANYEKVFIQSTSHTRILDANTTFLYVIDELGHEFDPYVNDLDRE